MNKQEWTQLDDTNLTTHTELQSKISTINDKLKNIQLYEIQLENNINNNQSKYVSLKDILDKSLHETCVVNNQSCLLNNESIFKYKFNYNNQMKNINKNNKYIHTTSNINKKLYQYYI
jgi:predicted nuclease with TOPRIM domain